MLRILIAALSLAASFNAAAANPQVEIRTNMGAITLELYPDRAPETVKNFLQYVQDGFYDGTLFHRVIPGFMIQGGGFTVDLAHKPPRAPIRNEADNGLKNLVGTIAMARTRDPHSATSQFFINLADNPFLDFRAPVEVDYGYCVFGKVVNGMEIVNAIAKAPTAPRPPHQNVPIKPIVMESVRIVGQPVGKPAK
jgi:peptidyl-prolyl cis-trans isomerase B (cyclophilin B)